MDFERIDRVSEIKVVRAGKEKERRRRQESPEREFSEVLSGSIEENHEEKTEQDSNRPKTHSIDLVSISSEGRVSSEVMNATESVARLSIAQQIAIGLREPPADLDEPDQAEEETGDDETEISSVNTLA